MIGDKRWVQWVGLIGFIFFDSVGGAIGGVVSSQDVLEFFEVDRSVVDGGGEPEAMIDECAFA